VREALFSAVEAALGSLAGLRFLDLYAGSGAVGLEARSRGVGMVTLVEQDRRIAALIRENARALRLDSVDVVSSSVDRALAHEPRAPYDVVFADPPYAMGVEELHRTLRLLVEHGWLGPGALVVVERATRDGDLRWPEGYTPDRSRRYGETTLWYAFGTVTQAKPTSADD
jgi:16S rRNA (guanine966-N2)-methyltransferase